MSTSKISTISFLSSFQKKKTKKKTARAFLDEMGDQKMQLSNKEIASELGVSIRTLQRAMKEKSDGNISTCSTFNSAEEENTIIKICIEAEKNNSPITYDKLGYLMQEQAKKHKNGQINYPSKPTMNKFLDKYSDKLCKSNGLIKSQTILGVGDDSESDSDSNSELLISNKELGISPTVSTKLFANKIEDRLAKLEDRIEKLEEENVKLRNQLENNNNQLKRKLEDDVNNDHDFNKKYKVYDPNDLINCDKEDAEEEEQEYEVRIIIR